MKNKLMVSFVCALGLAAGACSKEKPTCEQVFDHAVSLAPAEMREMIQQNRESALQKCSKLSDEAKQCALAAKSMEALQKCPRS